MSWYREGQSKVVAVSLWRYDGGRGCRVELLPKASLGARGIVWGLQAQVKQGHLAPTHSQEGHVLGEHLCGTEWPLNT